jgi:hypothetical protein
MPINVTPISGLSDHSNDVRSHTGPGVDGQMVTNESLRGGARPAVLRTPLAASSSQRTSTITTR